MKAMFGSCAMSFPHNDYIIFCSPWTKFSLLTYERNAFFTEGHFAPLPTQNIPPFHIVHSHFVFIFYFESMFGHRRKDHPPHFSRFP